MNKLTVFFFLLFTFHLSLVSRVPAQNLTVPEIMQQPSIAGMRVEGEKLSPDGKYVVYLWNAEGKEPRDLYLVSTSGGEPRKILSPKDLLSDKPKEEKENKLNYGLIVEDDFAKAQKDQIGNLDWSPDSSRILFSQNGDLYVLKIGETKPRRLTNTKGFEGGASWLDNERIMFSQGGNLFAIDTEKFLLTQVSNEANPQKFVSIFGANASKNGEFVAYIVSDGSAQRALFVPNYLDEFVQTPSVRRGWSEQKVFVAKTDGSLEKPIEITLPKTEGKSYFSGSEWLADNKSLIIDRIDQTNKRRQMFLVIFDKENNSIAYLIRQEKDEKWIGGPGRILEAHPTDPTKFIFSSEEGSGYNHIWLLEDVGPSPGEDGNTKVKTAQSLGTKLTDGNWEVSWAKWAKSSNGENSNLVFASTKENTSERKLTVISNIPRSMSRIDLPLERGMKGDFQLENNTLLFSQSQWNSPSELYSIDLCFDCKKAASAVKLTSTTPEPFLKRKWNEPKFLEINSRDNKKIPAKIYLPADFNKSKKYPMVIFVHGAGYLQNVINGWNNYYREFMFNQLLTQRGYVVLDIDYRGSAGYGRDWRTDVYDFLGGKDYEDHLDAIDHMVANYSVDAKNVGVYGGSYGGFMAGMLVLRAPEKIAAAAALRPVFDWKNYYAANPVYTSQRLGIPTENPEAYKRSSPIFYADKLERPLLILHGLVDSNVHAQDSQQMIEKLIRLGKTEYFEAMLYPAENHAFERPTSWTDEYLRILNFFEKHLKN